jgi:hypothetical protein
MYLSLFLAVCMRVSFFLTRLFNEIKILYSFSKTIYTVSVSGRKNTLAYPDQTKTFLNIHIQDLKPVRMTNDADFERRMTFVESIVDVNDNYRHFDFIDHPAVVERLKVKDEENLEEDHDEL